MKWKIWSEVLSGWKMGERRRRSIVLVYKKRIVRLSSIKKFQLFKKNVSKKLSQVVSLLYSSF